MSHLAVKDLLKQQAEFLELTLVAGEAGLTNKISVPHVQQPGLAMAGYLRHIIPHRVQIFDKTEFGFLSQMPHPEARTVLENYFAKNPCCCVVTHNIQPPDYFLELAEATKTPLLRAKRPTQEFIDRITRYLEHHFARHTTMHGVLMDVFGVGVLMLGKSAIGKSECALDLILKGHRLVADDIVDLRRITGETVTGQGSEITKYHMEIRGLGIINIKEMFGISAIRDRKKVHMVVNFVEWNNNTEYDRIGLDDQYYQVLGVELPMIIIPVRPGRNLTAIVEVAARNHLLKMEGFNAAKAFQEILLRRIANANETKDTDEDAE